MGSCPDILIWAMPGVACQFMARGLLSLGLGTACFRLEGQHLGTFRWLHRKAQASFLAHPALRAR